MKLLYILKKVSQNRLRDYSVREFDQEEIIIGRGTSSDILFTSRVVSLEHARLTLSEGKLFVQDLGSSIGLRVNDRMVKKTSLKSEDILKIGDVSLKVLFEDNTWKLVETREEKPVEDESIQYSKAIDKIDISKRLPPYTAISLALVVLIVLFFLVAPLMGVNEALWESGPLTNAHRFLQKDCKQCHQSSFEKIKDKTCQTCHVMGDHSNFLKENTQYNEKCVSCHEEHNSNETLIPDDPTFCVNCHAKIQEIHPKTKYQPITGFGETHPEFALIRQNMVDRTKIKFNHNFHLTHKKVRERTTDKQDMTCEDCHVPDSSGAYMKPITFDENCLSCHKLEIGPESLGLRIPHEKPAFVRAFLESIEDFLYEHIDADSGSFDSASQSKKEWVNTKMGAFAPTSPPTKRENTIFFSTMKSCGVCHVWDVKPVASLSPNSSLAAFSLWDHDVAIFDINTEYGYPGLRLTKGHEDIVNSARFSPDGNLLLTASRDFTARIWRLDNLEKTKKTVVIGRETVVLLETAMVFRKHTGSVNDAAFNSAQDKIITGSNDNTAIIWEVGTQKVIHTLAGHKSPVLKVSFNRDGTRALTRASDYTAIIWDAKSGQSLAVKKPRFLDVTDVKFSPDGSKVAGAMSDGSIQIWSAEDGKELHTLPKGQGPHDFSSGHGKEVNLIAFSPDGSKLVSLSKDQSAKIWDLNNNTVRATLVSYVSVKGGKEKIKPQRFLTAMFSHDGSKVITGSTDKITRLWDADSGELLTEFTGPDNPIHAALLNSDSSKVVTVADNNEVVIWELPQGSARKRMTKGSAFNELKHGKLRTGKDEQLRLPNILPPDIPGRFFKKGLFNHRKHQLLHCNVCHAQVEESISTSDVHIPPIKLCRTCHEKEGIQLNQCVHCHVYHPEGTRWFPTGQIALDDTAPLGYSKNQPPEKNP